MSKLLILEDEDDISAYLQDLLASKFEQIDIARSIDEAKEFVITTKYDLVSVDIYVSGRNGAELIQTLFQTDNINHKTPIIIISAYVNPEFIKKNKHRFSGIFIKPFDHDQLLHLVEEILTTSKEGQAVQNSDLSMPLPNCELPFPIAQLQEKVNVVLQNVKKSPKLKELFSKMQVDRSNDNYMLHHIGLLINVSIGIATHMDWSTEKTLEKFVYAAYLHDLALRNRVDLAKIKSLEQLDELKSTLSKEDYELAFNHPEMAAKTISEYPDLPMDVDTIVRQHHERPFEQGFPNKLSIAKIAPLSAVFIIAHDLTDFIIENPNWTMEAYLKQAQKIFRGSHFNKILLSLNDLK